MYYILYDKIKLTYHLMVILQNGQSISFAIIIYPHSAKEKRSNLKEQMIRDKIQFSQTKLTHRGSLPLYQDFICPKNYESKRWISLNLTTNIVLEWGLWCLAILVSIYRWNKENERETLGRKPDYGLLKDLQWWFK